jgi:Rod binding domain-containing protein
MASLLHIGMTGASAVGSDPAPEPRLARAAHEFEAQLMKELLRPLTQSSAVPGDDEDGTGGTSTLGEYAVESLAEALSAHGGLGIANRIIGEISRSGNHSQNSPVTEEPPIDNVINLRK